MAGKKKIRPHSNAPRFQDTGCIYACKCEKCPFPLIDGECLRDLGGIMKTKIIKEHRDELALKGYWSGKSKQELMKTWGVKENTINHILSRAAKKVREKARKSLLPAPPPPQSGEVSSYCVTVQCMKETGGCSTIETLDFEGDKMTPTVKFEQGEDGKIRHLHEDGEYLCKVLDRY